MADYWKSTPKYWCEHCSVYVRDTKLERTNHESTGKHKGNLSRYLRNIHKDNDREQREKQRAKDEIARLNGLPLSTSDKIGSKATVSGSSSAPGPARQATAEDRKQQMAQLAALGVAVPEQYRRTVAMAGDWQTVGHTPAVKPEPEIKREAEDLKAVVGNSGIKRPVPDSSTEDQRPGKRKITWGSATKEYNDGRQDDELENLLGSTTILKKKVKPEPTGDDAKTNQPESYVDIEKPSVIALEPGTADAKHTKPEAAETSMPELEEKASIAEDDSEVIFKKRKSKSKR